MSRARYGAAALLVVSLEVAAEPPPVTATLTCNAEACGAFVFDSAAVQAVCIAAREVTGTPRVEDADGRTRAMVRRGARWCTPIAIGTTPTLVVGARRRPITLVQVTPDGFAGDAVDNQWAIVENPADDEIKMLGDKEVVDTNVDDEPVILMDIGKEPVESTPEPGDVVKPAAKEPTPAPASGAVAVAARPPKVVDGEPVAAATPALPDDRSFLDVVGVGDAGGYHCSGVLIAPRAVLTAAHCAPATRVGFGGDVERFLAAADVVDAVVHPTLDVAVLRLAAVAVIPVRPRRRGADLASPRGVLRMVGFGVDDPRAAAGFGIKRRVDVPTEDWGCDRRRAISTGCVPGAELVLAGVGGRDTCWGDSGGPVLELVDQAFRLLAITSRPTARGGAACGRGGIYVRVDAIDAWLTEAVEGAR